MGQALFQQNDGTLAREGERMNMTSLGVVPIGRPSKPAEIADLVAFSRLIWQVRSPARNI